MKYFVLVCALIFVGVDAQSAAGNGGGIQRQNIGVRGIHRLEKSVSKLVHDARHDSMRLGIDSGLSSIYPMRAIRLPQDAGKLATDLTKDIASVGANSVALPFNLIGGMVGIRRSNKKLGSSSSSESNEKNGSSSSSSSSESGELFG